MKVNAFMQCNKRGSSFERYDNRHRSGKNIFHVHGADAKGRRVFSEPMSRAKLVPFIANLPLCLVGMEACATSNYWARRFQAMGHEVRLISPHFVKPYVKSNKNDRNDVEAICEAVSRPTMRFVAIKTMEQQDRQCLLRVRQRLISQRTSLVNQIRGLLGEYGIVVAKHRSRLQRVLPEVLEDGENGLSTAARQLFAQLSDELLELDKRIVPLDQSIKSIAHQDELCQRLQKVEGVGPLIATAVTATVGDANVFKNGRQFAAYLGLVPKQHSSGGKIRLGCISKRGDTYLRTLLVQGAQSAVRWSKNRDTPKARWIKTLIQRRGRQRAVVAIANKNARILWALMARGGTYHPVGG